MPLVAALAGYSVCLSFLEKKSFFILTASHSGLIFFLFKGIEQTKTFSKNCNGVNP